MMMQFSSQTKPNIDNAIMWSLRHKDGMHWITILKQSLFKAYQLPIQLSLWEYPFHKNTYKFFQTKCELNLTIRQFCIHPCCGTTEPPDCTHSLAAARIEAAKCQLEDGARTYRPGPGRWWICKIMQKNNKILHGNLLYFDSFFYLI